MLLPSLGNKQHKVNKNIFEIALMFYIQKIYKKPYFYSILFCFNFILINKIISYLFDLYYRMTFDPGGK